MLISDISKENFHKLSFISKIWKLYVFFRYSKKVFTKNIWSRKKRHALSYVFTPAKTLKLIGIQAIQKSYKYCTTYWAKFCQCSIFIYPACKTLCWWRIQGVFANPLEDLLNDINSFWLVMKVTTTCTNVQWRRVWILLEALIANYLYLLFVLLVRINTGKWYTVKALDINNVKVGSAQRKMRWFSEQRDQVGGPKCLTNYQHTARKNWILGASSCYTKTVTSHMWLPVDNC